MSNLFDLDEENDELFKPNQEKPKPRRDLDDFFGTGSKSSTKSDTLDDVLAPNDDGDLFGSVSATSKAAASGDDLDDLLNAQTGDGKGVGKDKKTKQQSNKAASLFENDVDDEPDIFGFGKTNKTQSKTIINDDDLFGFGVEQDDLFSNIDNVQNKSSEPVSEPSGKPSRVRADSLEMCLDDQPTSTDDMLPVIEPESKPKERKGLQRKPSKLKRKSRIVNTDKLDTNKESSSLDDMLDAQPDETISNTDNKNILPAESSGNQVNINYIEPNVKNFTETNDNTIIETNDKEPASDNGTIDDIDTIVTHSEIKQEALTTLPDKAADVPDDNILTEITPAKPTEPSEDNLDMLLDSQSESIEATPKPKARKGLQRKPSKLRRKSKIVTTDKVGTNEEPSSLDDMLNAQPGGIVSVSEDLSSTTENKNIVQDTPAVSTEDQVQSSEPNVKTATLGNVKAKPEEDIEISTNVKREKADESLDKMVDTQPEVESINDDIDKKVTQSEIKQETKPADNSQTLPDKVAELPSDKNQSGASTDKVTDPSVDNLDMLLDSQPESIGSTPKPKVRKGLQRKPSKLRRKSKIIITEKADTNEEPSSLDDMLNAQPDAKVSVNEGLSSTTENKNIDIPATATGDQAEISSEPNVKIDTQEIVEEKSEEDIDISTKVKQENADESLDKLLDTQPEVESVSDNFDKKVIKQETKPADNSQTLTAIAAELPSDKSLSNMSTEKPTDPSEDTLDMLLDSQSESIGSTVKPKVRKGLQRKPSKLRRKSKIINTDKVDTNEEQSSLDDMLNAQPVSVSEDLSSTTENKTIVQDTPATPTKDQSNISSESDVKTATQEKDEEKTREDIEILTNVKQELPDDSLDNMVDVQPEPESPTIDKMVPNSEIKNETKQTDSTQSVHDKATELVNDTNLTETSLAKPTDPSEDNLDMLLDSQPDTIEQSVKPKERKGLQRKPSKLKRKSRIIKTEKSDDTKEPDNLDDMLNAQPDELVSVNDDLSSMVVKNSDTPLDTQPESSDDKGGAEVDSVSEDVKATNVDDKVLGDEAIHTVDDDKSNSMKQDVSEESLDKMLHTQPAGTLSPSDDIQSLVTPNEKPKPVSKPPVKPRGEVGKVSKPVHVTADETVISKPEQSSPTDALSGETDKKNEVDELHGAPMDEPEDNLDTLLDAQPDSTVPSNDDLQSLFMKTDVRSTESDVKPKNKPSLRRKPSKLNRKSRNIDSTKTESSKEPDSLDAMLDAQPDGMVPATEDLLTFVEPITNNAASSNTHATTESISQASPTKVTDPVDDLFGESNSGNLIDDIGFADEDSDVETGDKFVIEGACESDTEDKEPVEEDTEPVEPVPRKTNLKKTNMERSFEDLLNGLSDESDTELEDIIPDDIDNTNLERRLKQKSLLGSPDKSYRDIRPDTSEFTSKHIDDPFDMDVISSTPNTRKPAESSQMKVTPPNVTPPVVRLHTPEDEEEDFDISGDRDDIDAGHVVDDVEMRSKPTRTSKLSSGDDVDLEVIEDTNHLDVDVSKHKSALGKKGSLALRRKPSRKSRKSLLSTAEDAIFKDSTDGKAEMMNGDDDDDMFDTKDEDDDERYDLSPPAKKPSPVTMMPLPGLAGRPPSQRLSPSKTEDEEENKEVKRKSKPPPGAFVLPPMGASPKKPLRPSSESGEKSPRESKPSSFEKPALKSVKPTDRSRSPARDESPSYSRGGLRATDKSDVEMKPASEERDVTFQKPSLRSTPKPRDRTPEQKMDTNEGMFEKPALRNTPKPKLEQKPNQPTEQEDVFATKNLRSVPKPDNFTKDLTSDKHVFDKPQLKTPKVESDGDSNKHDSSSKYREKSFEKPTLRSTNKNVRSESTEDAGYEPSGMFEKPSLRTAGGRTTATNKEDNFTSGMFEKPSLKKTTPCPEKEVKDLNEPKGTFDRPPLRKTDSLKEREEKARTADKPSWLQKASDKHGRALDVLQTKENQNNSEKQVPSWLEKSPLRKNKGLPLQDTSNNQSTSSSQSDLSTEDYVKSTSSTPRSRNSSQGTENEPDRKASLPGPREHNNYTPGWMRQARSPSVPGVVSPAKSMPALNESNEVPQWKRELAQRRQNRKEKTSGEDLPKKVDNAEPEWKKGIMLRKTRNTSQPSKESHSVEPEWKKAAEEKRQRLRNSAVDKTDH